MKSRFLAIICLVFLLFSCNKENPSVSDDHTISIDINSVIHTSAWDDKVLQMLYVSVSDANTLIPQCEAESFDVNIGKESNVTYTRIKCNGIDPLVVTDNYENNLLSHSFKLMSDMPVGYMEVTITDDLYIQYQLVEDFFELLVYRVSVRYDEWPSPIFIELFGEDIPCAKAESYEFGVTQDFEGRTGIYLYCNKVTSNYDETYAALLQENGYVVTGNRSLYIAINEEKEIKIEFYLFEANCLYLQAFSTGDLYPWPSNSIIRILGYDLPKYEEEGTKLSYRYMDVEDGTSVFIIYYDYASSSSLTAYGQQLIALGYEKSIDESHESSTIKSDVYYQNKGLENEHMIQVMYHMEENCLAIAIYY